MNLTIVAGARPNFIKIAPLIKAIEKQQAYGVSIQYRLVHTGQHYDKNLSDTFFEELGIPQPNANLMVKSASQAEQTARIMIAFEEDLINNPTDLVIVVGDVNSTMACAIVAKKLCVEVAHIEAGIRSHDLTMPEEINRMVTDSITDHFFTTSELATQNLIKLGIKEQNIYFVGNIMIDTLLANKHRFIEPEFWQDLKLEKENYLVMTLHRPSNVDELDSLKNLIENILSLSNEMKIIFPVHPRTKAQLDDLNIEDNRLCYVNPLSYLRFNYLVQHACAVITDSGGITEETTVLGVPCITLRENTERPETITVGTNRLVGHDLHLLKKAFTDLYKGEWPQGEIPLLWDGKTADRIIYHLLALPS